MPASSPAVCVDHLSHAYGARQAISHLSFSVAPAEIFVFLGPNGGGKTTLFRVLSTLVPVQSGSVHMLGFDLATQTSQVRARMGVVFQAPSLDKKLTVAENIRHQAALYGIHGSQLRRREDELLDQLGLRSRRRERTETLSGGLRRRVELAKGMIHRPQLLLLDEPSTGLDPGARNDLWTYLRQLRDESQVTVLLTTHLLEEADKADRIGILHQGSVVALDEPNALRSSVGGDSITIETADAGELTTAIADRFQLEATVIDGRLRLELPAAGPWIARLVAAFPREIRSITLAKPTLEDVFIQKTGHRFW